MKGKKTAIIILVTFLAISAGVSTVVLAQAAKDSGKMSNTIEIYYLKWLQNDITRNVEEIRRAQDPWERRDLVEDIEQYIYDRVEFPLSYARSEEVGIYNNERIDTKSDVLDSRNSSPVAQEVALAYALLGIAKGYEGFGIAATDYFDKATAIFPRVMDVEVRLDHTKDNKRLSEWIATSRGYWGNSSTTRVTFYGKRISQEVVDSLNTDEIGFTTDNRKASQYALFVAKRDFVRGLKRYITTDDTLKEYRPNKFIIYLEPGEYRIRTSVSALYDIRLRVSRNINENNFILETLQSGITCYPIPDISVFEDEMKKALMKAREKKDDQDSATEPTGEELNNSQDFPLE